MSAVKTRIAFLLRALATRIEPPVVLVPDTEPAPGPGEQMLFAQKLIDDMTIRDALYRSLHRYSPAPETPQA